MLRPLTHPDVARPLLRGICLVVTGNEKRADRQDTVSAAASATSRFPRRPDPRAFSETILLFFIGRNKNGLWLAREAEGRAGGIFLFKRSALRFAAKNGAPVGCATMFLSERFELDVENQGGLLGAGLDAAMRLPARTAPRLIAFLAAAVAAAQNFIGGQRR